MAVPRDTWSEVLNNGPKLDKSVLKNKGLVFQCTAQAIWFINHLFYGKKLTEYSP